MLKEDVLESLRERVDEHTCEIVAGVLDEVLKRYTVSESVLSHTAIGGLPVEASDYIAAKKSEGCSAGFLKNCMLRLSALFREVNVPVNAITVSHLRAYLGWYKDTRKVSDRTLNSMRVDFNGFFAWLVDEGYIDKNPCKLIKKIHVEHKQRISLTSLELEYMRQACESLRESAFIEVLYSTGCRISEIAGMMLADIDWLNRTVKVFGKGKKERVVFLNDKAYIALRKYIDSRDDENPAVFVYERAPHCSLNVAGLQRAYSIVLSRTGGKVRHHSPHNMRHTTATLALSSGMPIESISRMLGHANIATTLIYAETDEEKLHSEHRRYVV